MRALTLTDPALIAPKVPTYGAVVAALSPIAYWPMQETSGTTMTAATGNNGSYANGPTLAVAGPSAKIPNAVSFDGSNDYASAAIDLSAVAEITVSFWMWLASYSNDDRMGLELSSTPDSVRSFSIDPNHYIGSGFCGVMAQGNSNWRAYRITRPSTSTWHHYAVRFSRTAQTVTFVVDGSVSSPTQSLSGTVSGNFVSSTLYFMSRGGASLFCAGRLAQVAVFSGLLSDASCGLLYAAGA